MVFVSMDLTAPSETYRLTNQLHFKTIKVMEFIIQTNNIVIPGSDNMLLCMNRYNDNMFIFPASTGNSSNTQYLANIPYIATLPISYSPVNIIPPDFQREDAYDEATRELRIDMKHPDGSPITVGEWAGTSAHVILHFE